MGDSDDDDEDFLFLIQNYLQEENVHGGSLGRRQHCNRGNKEGHSCIMCDYFDTDPIYNDQLFRCRFRMWRELFLQIIAAVTEHDAYYTMRADVAGRIGLSPIQKVTAALRQLAYRSPAGAVDEYIRMGEGTAVESLQHLYSAVVDVFGIEYLRAQTAEYLERILSVNTERGFPGMLGSLDCMHQTKKIFQMLGKGNILEKRRNQQLFLQPLLRTICGYGMPTLACLALITT
jgi:hypothetical protein